MEENVHNPYKQSLSGWEVWPSKRAKLPGYFSNILQAQRAYDRYIAEGRAVAKNKKAKTTK